MQQTVLAPVGFQYSGPPQQQYSQPPQQQWSQPPQQPPQQQWSQPPHQASQAPQPPLQAPPQPQWSQPPHQASQAPQPPQPLQMAPIPMQQPIVPAAPSGTDEASVPLTYQVYTGEAVPPPRHASQVSFSEVTGGRAKPGMSVGARVCLVLVGVVSSSEPRR